jgi:hypothetical protein
VSEVTNYVTWPCPTYIQYTGWLSSLSYCRSVLLRCEALGPFHSVCLETHANRYMVKLSFHALLPLQPRFLSEGICESLSRNLTDAGLTVSFQSIELIVVRLDNIYSTEVHAVSSDALGC